MAGISINSGAFTLGDSNEVAPTSGEPLKVLVLGDFSGRNSRGLHSAGDISTRKQYRIDKDNFDEVFSALKVSLRLAVSEELIQFNEIDDLHPDHLYENVSLFNRYRTLLRKIKTPKLFHETVEALVEEGLVDRPEKRGQGESVDGTGLLDTLLSSPSSEPSESSIQALIRQTVAPYVESKENPQVAEYSVAVEAAVNDVMRRVMHTSDFQRLEASWRGLDLINRRLDTDRECMLHVMDVTREELLTDLGSTDAVVKESQLYQSVIDQHSVAGGKAFDVILVDVPLEGEGGVQLLSAISELASLSDAVVLSGVDFESFKHIAGNTITDTDSPNEAMVSWSDLRSKAYAKSTYVASPSFMLRLPYGKKTARVESFGFEELPALGAHQYYLWGNSAYLVLVNLFSCGSGSGGGVVGSLPIHVYSEAGENMVTPCSEYYLSSSEVTAIERCGGTVMQSIKGRDEVMIERLNAVSE